MKSFAHQIRDYRIKNNLTQEKFIELTKVIVSKTYLSRLEHGHDIPSLEVLCKFSFAMGLDHKEQFEQFKKDKLKAESDKLDREYKEIIDMLLNFTYYNQR